MATLCLQWVNFVVINSSDPDQARQNTGLVQAFWHSGVVVFLKECLGKVVLNLSAGDKKS